MFNQRFTAGLLCLTLFSLSVAYAHDEHEHEHDSHEHMGHAHSPTLAMADDGSYYFSYLEHRGLLYAHMLTMSIGWIFIMPVCEYLILYE